MMEEGRGRKEPSDRRNPVADSNLSAGRSWKWGGDWTREASHRMVQETPCVAQHGR